MGHYTEGFEGTGGTIAIVMYMVRYTMHRITAGIVKGTDLEEAIRNQDIGADPTITHGISIREMLTRDHHIVHAADIPHNPSGKMTDSIHRHQSGILENIKIVTSKNSTSDESLGNAAV